MKCCQCYPLSQAQGINAPLYLYITMHIYIRNIPGYAWACSCHIPEPPKSYLLISHWGRVCQFCHTAEMPRFGLILVR